MFKRKNCLRNIIVEINRIIPIGETKEKNYSEFKF